MADLGSFHWESESGLELGGRLHAPIQDQASSYHGSFDNQWICKPPQEQLPGGGFTFSDPKAGNRDCAGLIRSSLFQKAIPSTKTKQQRASHSGSEYSKPFLGSENIQNEDLETIRISLQTGEWFMLLNFCDAYTIFL